MNSQYLPKKDCAALVFFIIAGLSLLIVLGGRSSSSTERPLIVYIRSSFYQNCHPALMQVLSEEEQSRVHFICLGGNSLMGRLRHAKEKTNADLVIGTDGCFSKEISELGAASPVSLAPELWSVPVHWPHHNIIPFCYGYIGLLCKTSHFSKKPENLQELLSHKLSITAPNPRTSSVGLVFMHWVHSSKSIKSTPIESKITALPKGLSGALALFIEGQADLMASYTTSSEFAALKHSVFDIEPIFLDPSPFHAYTAFITPKGAQDPLAKKLIHALLGLICQEELMTKDCMYPVHQDLDADIFFKTKRPKNSLIRTDLNRKDRLKLLKHIDKETEKI